MIKYRCGIFETNSSSCHSIVVSSKDRGIDYRLPIDDTGTLNIRFGEYGWGPDLLTTPYEKICYWATDHVLTTTKKIPVNKFKILKQLNIKLNNLKYIIKKNCPRVKNIKLILNNDKYNILGTIDHQSLGTTTHIKENEELENFIFENKYIVIIDNDNNYCFEECSIEELFEVQKNSNKKKFLEDLIKKYKAKI